MRLRLSHFIERDLNDIAEYIVQDNPKRALTVIENIEARFLEISRNPLIYQLRPEIGPAARLATVGSYAILFRVVENTVQVERVVYGSRDLPGILNPSLTREDLFSGSLSQAVLHTFLRSASSPAWAICAS
jgi:toxin ParE1/3/4